MMNQRGAKKKLPVCAFGALVAVLLVPAGVAHADQTDQDFTNFLSSHGINLGNTDQTVNMARVMCQDLNAGYTQKDEIDQLTGAHRLNQSQAEMFVGAATADYCPGKHSPTRPKGK
ncbi:DUF732 domain-containing protein [Mycobacterium sp. E3198]|uniref:DUF732 domain-containing protein n=1 Tax=Mycobacterium sp. E3198 TaxID=1834143 RepID=UPI0008001238|nr:DUF732 domain-containing protein [Mycobacterium sp. E3198]OBG29851.1 hypothetical protein A5673_04685 [Mycobacterium sp. E3198]